MKTKHRENEFENFTTLVSKVLSVSHDEIMVREAEWRKQHPKKMRKAKPSAVSRVVSEKG